MPDERDRRLAQREKPVSGSVEDYREEAEGEDEGPQAADLARFGDVTMKCPECGTELFDDVALCWKCGRPVGPGAPGESKGPPVWVIVAVVVVVAAFVLGLVGGVL